MQCFQEYHDEQKRVIDSCQEVLALIELAATAGIEPSTMWKAAIDEAIVKLKNGRFEVAFIGQIKTGKTTLINAMVFGCEVLPVDIVPQTAKLTLIRHGQDPAATVFFYTPEEWDRFRQLAEEEGVVPDTLARSETVQVLDWMRGKDDDRFSYRQYVRDAERHVGSDLRSLLGKSRKVELHELKQYVATFDPKLEKGKYSFVTCRAEVQYPHTWPQQVDFVDTPGTNDPIEIRSQITLDYLRRADAVVFVLYAAQALSRADLELLQEQLLPVGFEKILVVLNKFDMVPNEQGEDLECYVRDLLRRNVLEAARNEELRLPPGFEDVLETATLYPVSSLRALLGRAKGRISEGDYHFKQTCSRKGINTYEEAVQESRIEPFETGLRSFLLAHKGSQLLRAPIDKSQGVLSDLRRSCLFGEKRCEERSRALLKDEQQLRDELAGQKEEYTRIQASLEDLESLLRRKSRRELGRAQRDAKAKVAEFEREVRGEYMARLRSIGAFGDGKLQSLNRDLGWRIRELSENVLRTLNEGLERLSNALQEDLRHTAKSLIAQYRHSERIQETIDEISCQTIKLDLKTLAPVRESSMWLISRLIWTTHYREKLQDQLATQVQEYSDVCQQLICEAITDLLEQLEQHCCGILTGVRQQIEDQIKDLEEALCTRSKRRDEVCQDRDSIDAKQRTYRAIRTSVESLAEKIARLET